MHSPQEVSTEVGEVLYMADVYDLPFYHGPLPTSHAEMALKKNGDFLIRQTFRRNELVFCLSVRTGIERVRNFLVIQSDEGKFYFERIQANTVTELVQLHLSSGTPLSEMSQTVILRPVLRPEWMLDGDKLSWNKELGESPLGGCYAGTFKDGKRERNIIIQVVENPENFHFGFKLARAWRGEIYRMIEVKCLGVVISGKTMSLIFHIRTGTSFPRYLIAFREMEKMVIEQKRNVGMHSQSF